MKPTIMIYIDSINNTILKEVTAGIEEEGVLYEIVQMASVDGCNGLALEAAKASLLEIGIGICLEEVIIQIVKMKGKPLFKGVADYRRLGQNAARYVKGNHFL